MQARLVQEEERMHVWEILSPRMSEWLKHCPKVETWVRANQWERERLVEKEVRKF